MPEFEVTVLTTRAGTHTVHVEAADASTALGIAQAECDSGECHCPPEWCTDDVETNVLSVRYLVRTELPLLVCDGRER
jgi:hypothetical protein